jgi:hypothetical protein
MQGEVVRRRGVGEHQRGEVVAVRRPQRLGVHVLGDAAQRRRLGAWEPQPARAEQHEALHPLALARREGAGDDAAEGEAGEVVAPRRWQQVGEARGEDRGEALRRPGFGRGVGLAVAGQVRRDHAEAFRQRRDAAEPVRPGAEIAVQQHERRRAVLAPQPPDHAACSARRGAHRAGPLDLRDRLGGCHGVTFRSFCSERTPEAGAGAPPW